METRRLVTTRIYVAGPQFTTVSVAAVLYVKKGSSAADTQARAEDALTLFLDPIQGGPPPQTGWPFGRPVYPSEIYQLLAKVEGVDYASSVSLNGQLNQAVVLPVDGLPYPGVLNLQAIPYEQRNQQTPSACGPNRRGGCGCA